MDGGNPQRKLKKEKAFAMRAGTPMTKPRVIPRFLRKELMQEVPGRQRRRAVGVW